MIEDFEWDPERRLANLEKHNLDFYDAVEIFRGRYINLRSRRIDEELRHVAVGIRDGKGITIAYVIRGSVYRVISARRARKNERTTYYALFPAEPSQGQD